MLLKLMEFSGVESADRFDMSTEAQHLGADLAPSLTAYGRSKPIQQMRAKRMDLYEIGNLTMCDNFM